MVYKYRGHSGELSENLLLLKKYLQSDFLPVLSDLGKPPVRKYATNQPARAGLFCIVLSNLRGEGLAFALGAMGAQGTPL
jgi:hypothetical protein